MAKEKSFRAGLLILLLITAGIVGYVWNLAFSISSRPRIRATLRQESVKDASANLPMLDIFCPSIGRMTGHLAEMDIEDATGVWPTVHPERLVLDDDGNFLYLRNRAPIYKSQQRMDLVEKFFDESYKLQAKSSYPNPFKFPDTEFKILKLVPFDLSDSLHRQTLHDIAGSQRDIEVWSLRVMTPNGEMNILLEASSSGDISGPKVRYSFCWQYGLSREWTIHKPREEGGFERNRGIVIVEEWEQVPPEAEPKDHKGDGVGFVWEGRIVDYDTYAEIQTKLGNPPPVPR